MIWILLTLLAALMQAIRTAGQKQLLGSIDIVIVSWVRFVFGLPFAILFFLLLVPDVFVLLDFTYKYWLFVIIVSLSQLFATLLAVTLLERQNFAIGSTLVKSESIFTALFGLLLFSESLSGAAWFAVLLGITGLFVASMGKFNLKMPDVLNSLDSTSAFLGLAAGVLFGVASVFIRQANLMLGHLHAPITQAVITLTSVLFIQTLAGGIFIILTRKNVIKPIIHQFPVCIFIGLTSMLGSFGWFSAYALQNAAYVKTLGQIEFIFTLCLTWFYFKEKILFHEYIAMVLICFSALVITWAR